MGAPQGKSLGHRRTAGRAYPEHPHRRRHRRRLCRHLGRVRALQFHRCGDRLRLARHRRTGDARRRADARPGACRTRPGRRLCDAPHRFDRTGKLLGALHLPRGRHCRRLPARARADVAMARHHRRRVRLLLDAARPRLARQDRRRRAFVPCRRRVCTGRDLHRLRLAVRPRRRTREDRSRFIGRARGLPLRCAADRIDEPARHSGARRLCRAYGSDRRHCVAHRRCGRRGTVRGRDGRADVPAILGQCEPRTARAAVGTDRRRNPGTAARVLWNASRAGRRVGGAVRRRRIPRARPLDASNRADPVGCVGGVRAARDPGCALLSNSTRSSSRCPSPGLH